MALLSVGIGVKEEMIDSMVSSGSSVFDRINEIGILKVLGSVFLGVAAGYFPARWTSKLRPIEAVTRR